MIRLQLAEEKELDAAMRLIQEAKEHLKSQGIDQWQQGYPDVNCIQNDITGGKGYFIIENGTPIGYMCIDFNGEPAYEHVKGKWKSNGKYGVVHRLALSSSHRGKGLAGIAFTLAEDVCRQAGGRSIRADTDAANMKMQHILSKNGFEYCGTIWFDNSEKIAFEKILV